MGSLMAGWDSPSLNTKSDIYKRNRSLTKEEIEDYWRLNKKPTDEGLKEDIPRPSDHTIISQESIIDLEDSGRKFQISRTMPVPRTKEAFMDMDTTETSAAHDKALINNNGWWTRSNWAFLNEPPVSDQAASNTYPSQFHVPTWASKSNPPDGTFTT